MEEVSIVGVDLGKQSFKFTAQLRTEELCFGRSCRGRSFRDLWPDFGRVWLQWRLVERRTIGAAI